MSNLTETTGQYTLGPTVRWVVERRGILMLDDIRGAVCSLIYPAAAIWDLMSREYSYQKIVEMLTSIAGLEFRETEKYVSHALEEWTAIGLLSKAV